MAAPWLEPAGLARIRELAERGLTNVEISNEMGIALRTLTSWRNKYKEIDKAVRGGKVKPDKKVEDSLYNRSLGYNWTETVTMKVPDENGKLVIAWVKETTRHVPGDVTAMIYYTKNRMPDRWSNRDRDPMANKKIQIVLSDEAAELAE